MNQTHFTMELAEELLSTLKSRFQANNNRHAGISWDSVEARLRTHVSKLWSLYMMEKTARAGCFHRMLLQEKSSSTISAETPAGRRSLCYDRAAWDSRKENKPETSAIEKAESMSISILTEDEYRAMQTLGELTARHPVGWSRRKKSANAAARSSATADMTMCLPIITARDLLRRARI
ncbi:MAG: DUF4256 domain-containing protein [Eubacteriales bacterium]